jgi:hypothetical protein
VVLGPPPAGEKEGQPLRGADKLLDAFNRDTLEQDSLAAQSKALRLKERELAAEVQRAEGRYMKQTEIRENLNAEFSFLAGFEVTVYEDRETVMKRKRQLQRALEKFGPVPVRN